MYNWIIFIPFNCRQVDPSTDNFAARALPSDIQRRNVRKVQINAKVTCAICILETVSMTLLFLARKIFHNYEISMIVAILFLYVAIPFTFLKNSSENKDALVDVGFLNIIKKTIGIQSKHLVDPSPNVSLGADTPDVNYNKFIGSDKELRAWAIRLGNPFQEEQLKSWAIHLENPFYDEELREGAIHLENPFEDQIKTQTSRQ